MEKNLIPSGKETAQDSLTQLRDTKIVEEFYLLNIEQVAILIREDTETVEQLVDKGDLKAIKGTVNNKSLYFELNEILKYAKQIQLEEEIEKNELGKDESFMESVHGYKYGRLIFFSNDFLQKREYILNLMRRVMNQEVERIEKIDVSGSSLMIDMKREMLDSIEHELKAFDNMREFIKGEN